MKDNLIRHSLPSLVMEGERSFNSAVAQIINMVAHHNEKYRRPLSPSLCYNLLLSVYFSFVDRYKTLDELKKAILEQFGLELLPRGFREVVCQKD